MTNSQQIYTLEQGDPERPPTGRPVVYATQGVISSGHYLTSMAGMRMLLDGGNAFDAVAAAAFAAAVVEPIASYSLAAEGVFMLYHAESGDLLSLSGQGTAPGKATVEFYQSLGLDEIPTGPGDQAHLSFTVPGIVDALLSLVDRYGTRTLGEVLAPSIHYAERGIPNYEYMLERMKNAATRRQFEIYPPGGTSVFYDDGDLPAPGSVLVQPGLADVFKRMVAAESAAYGHRRDGIRAARDAFYRGDIARTIVDCAQGAGGILSLEDLAGFEAEYEQPISTGFHGYDVYGQSVWTQGAVLLQTLNILERFDLRSMGHNSAAYVHTVTEALKLALADREAHYGDPNFSTVPVDGLLSKQYAAERAALIDPSKASPDLPPAGDPWLFSSASKPQAQAPAPAGVPGNGAGDDSGTTHVAALDRDGNMICATPSGGGFAKSVYFPEIGCALSTRMEMLNFQKGHPNELRPNKRPRTTLVNYIVAKDGQPLMTVGCPGGDHQAQANVQLILNTLLFGMNPQQAIEAPRFASDSAVNSFYPHTHYAGQLSLEPGFSEETVAELAAMGHKPNPSAVCGMGATVARRDPSTGVLSTGGDPRRACYAIGW